MGGSNEVKGKGAREVYRPAKDSSAGFSVHRLCDDGRFLDLSEFSHSWREMLTQTFARLIIRLANNIYEASNPVLV